MSERDLLYPGEAAKVFGVSPRTVRRWVDKGRLDAVRTPGGHCRLFREEVRALAGLEPEEELEPHPFLHRRASSEGDVDA